MSIEALKEIVEIGKNLAKQWCKFHECHQDNPDHDYYPYCEKYLRESTWIEDLELIISLSEGKNGDR